MPRAGRETRGASEISSAGFPVFEIVRRGSRSARHCQENLFVVAGARCLKGFPEVGRRLGLRGSQAV